MGGIFANCSSLTDLSPLKKWDVSSVTEMDETFEGCVLLEDLSPLADWDISNVVRVEDMFNGCISLNYLTHWQIGTFPM